MTLSGKTRLAGVIGWPVSHSRSPRLHGYWLERYGIDGAYLPMPVPPAKVEQALRALPVLGFAGVNVTVPHKQAALAVVDEADAYARRLGALNTIVVSESGRLVGSNSDGFGFMANLNAIAPSWRRDRPAVVLGAGGAAHAVVAALQDTGVALIRLGNRTKERARALAARLDGEIEVVAWEARADALAGAGLLVNATSLGMTGAPSLDIDLAALPNDAVVNDIVYTPLRTRLLEQAEGRGLVTVDGLGMLLHQARPGFAAWFGHEPEVSDELRRFVVTDLLR